MPGIKLEDIFVRVRGDVKDLQAKLASSTGFVKRFERQTQTSSKQLEGMFGGLKARTSEFSKSFKKGMEDSGKSVEFLAEKGGMLVGALSNPLVIATVAAGGLVLGMRDVVKEAAEFQTEFANVTTLLDATTVDILGLRHELVGLDSQLGSSAQLSKALYQALSAGISAEKSVEAVGSAAKFAKAALVDQFSAIDVGTTVINAYGMEVEQLDEVYDILFKTIEQGKTTGVELSQSLGTIIPTAAALGVELPDLTAALATMTKGGIKTDMAVTGLRQALLSFLTPSEQAKRLAKDLRVELNSETIASKGLSRALGDLAKASEGNAEATAVFFDNVRALTAALALTGDQSEEYAKIQKVVWDYSGAVNIAFEKQIDTLEAQSEALSNAIGKWKTFIGLPIAEWWGGVKGSLAEDLDKAFESDFMKFIRGVDITKMSKETQNLFRYIFAPEQATAAWEQQKHLLERAGVESLEELIESLGMNAEAVLKTQTEKVRQAGEELSKEQLAQIDKLRRQIASETEAAEIDLMPISDFDKQRQTLMRENERQFEILQGNKQAVLEMDKLFAMKWEQIERDETAFLEKEAAKRLEITIREEEQAAREKQKIQESFRDSYAAVFGESLELELGLLDKQRGEYKTHLDDKAAIDRWYAAEHNRIMQDMYDRDMDAFLESKMKSTELDRLYHHGMVSGFMSALDEKTAANIAHYEGSQELMSFYQDMMITSQMDAYRLMAEVGRTAFSSITTGISDMIFEGAKAEEVIEDIGKALVQAVVDHMIQTVVAAALAQTVQMAHAVFSTALAAEIAAAWTPAAVMVNAATFGAGAAAGQAALTQFMLAAQAMSVGLIPTADQGGIATGPMLVNVAQRPGMKEALVPLDRAEEFGFGGGGEVTFEEGAIVIVTQAQDAVSLVEELIPELTRQFNSVRRGS
jgi:TP901 family phage tail tape measure protein